MHSGRANIWSKTLKNVPMNHLVLGPQLPLPEDFINFICSQLFKLFLLPGKQINRLTPAVISPPPLAKGTALDGNEKSPSSVITSAKEDM